MTEMTLISVRVPKDVAKRLAKLAEAVDRSKSYVAGQAIEEFLTLQEWQVKAIRQGVTEADAGKLVARMDHTPRPLAGRDGVRP